jgi:hypothetical protein
MKGKTLAQNKSALIAVVTALLLVALSLVVSITGRTGVTNPHIRVETLTTAQRAVALRSQRYQVVQKAFDGEVATTAKRLQEATAAATAAGFLIAEELASNRAPANSEQLVSALLQRGMLKDFSKGQEAGSLVTPAGAIALRYRRTPIGVEVVSVGRNREAGPAILIRVPNNEQINESGIWMLGSLDEVDIPRPFAPEAELVALGWRPDPVPNLR